FRLGIEHPDLPGPREARVGSVRPSALLAQDLEEPRVGMPAENAVQYDEREVVRSRGPESQVADQDVRLSGARAMNETDLGSVLVLRGRELDSRRFAALPAAEVTDDQIFHP